MSNVMRQAAHPSVDQYRAVLFDMNGTFMFEGDRFGPWQDYYASYRAVGGLLLSPGEVRAAVDACYSAFLRDYADPKLVECFPSLAACVAAHAGVPVGEREMIEMTIVQHEVGKVPSWAAHSIRFVAERSAVAVVSNVWAPSRHWHAELAVSGVAASLSATVFSTEVGAIKPSPRLFLSALQAVGASPAEALFVGDSLERDIQPAKELGMSTCLVGGCAPKGTADFCVHSIEELAR